MLRTVSNPSSTRYTMTPSHRRSTSAAVAILLLLLAGACTTERPDLEPHAQLLLDQLELDPANGPVELQRETIQPWPEYLTAHGNTQMSPDDAQSHAEETLTDNGWELIDPTDPAAGRQVRGHHDRVVATIDILSETDADLPDGVSRVILRVGEEASGPGWTEPQSD